MQVVSEPVPKMQGGYPLGRADSLSAGRISARQSGFLLGRADSCGAKAGSYETWQVPMGQGGFL